MLIVGDDWHFGKLNLGCVLTDRVNFDNVGETEDEYSSFAYDALNTDFATVMLHNLAADGKPNARAATITAPMQPLENLKYTPLILFRDADTIIPYKDLYCFFCFLRRDHDNGRYTIPMIAKGIDEQILE